MNGDNDNGWISRFDAIIDDYDGRTDIPMRAKAASHGTNLSTMSLAIGKNN